MATITPVKIGGLDITKFEPAGTPNGGVIIIFYGSDGMKEPWGSMIQDYAQALGQKGFVAFIPDYLGFTKTEPGPGVFSVIEEKRSQWEGALADAIDHAKVGAKGVGLLGFSLDGHLCLRLRAKADILVEFFAPVLDGIGAPGKLSHAQIHHGKDDKVPGTDFHNAEVIKDVLEHERTPTELYSYDNAGHGFISPALGGIDLGGTDLGNANAHTESWARTLKFFAAYLEPGV